MIPNNLLDIKTEGNISGEHISMTIDEGSLQHIMSVLTDLYSDTAMACIREYSTNARDAQIEAGHDGPIDITLPSMLLPVFKVRDYGKGLSLDDIRNVYSKYGASTKRESNGFNGMLGLGAKSALTYTSSFTVVSVNGGYRHVVEVGRDEDGGGYMNIIDSVQLLTTPVLRSRFRSPLPTSAPSSIRSTPSSSGGTRARSVSMVRTIRLTVVVRSTHLTTVTRCLLILRHKDYGPATLLVGETASSWVGSLILLRSITFSIPERSFTLRRWAN